MTDENENFPTYAKKTPVGVEAYQWFPEDADHTQTVLRWLMHYRRTRFIIQPSSDDFLDAKQLLGFEHNGAGWDDFAWPGDWIVRNGPNSYSLYDNDDFRAWFGEVNEDD